MTSPQCVCDDNQEDTCGTCNCRDTTCGTCGCRNTDGESFMPPPAGSTLASSGFNFTGTSSGDSSDTPDAGTDAEEQKETSNSANDTP